MPQIKFNPIFPFVPKPFPVKPLPFHPLFPVVPPFCFTCPSAISNSNQELYNLVLDLAKSEVFGIETCCEKWDKAIKIFGGIYAYNQLVNLNDAQSNNIKKCICKAINRL
jgi:hypothetical protein